MEAVEIMERVLGAEHPNTKIVRKNYEVLLAEMKEKGGSWIQIVSRDVGLFDKCLVLFIQIMRDLNQSGDLFPSDWYLMPY